MLIMRRGTGDYIFGDDFDLDPPKGQGVTVAASHHVCGNEQLGRGRSSLIAFPVGNKPGA